MRYWLAIFAFCAVAGAVACFSPHYSNPGYYCFEDSNPACPDGQECVNGRCVRPGSNNTPEDMKASAQDLKGADMKGAKPDMTQQSNTGGCNELVQCLLLCSDQTCATDCYANADSAATSRMAAVQQCEDDYCVNVTGDCFDTQLDTSTQCQTCVNNSYAGLIGDTSICDPSPTTPSCNPKVCQSAVNDCLSN